MWVAHCMVALAEVTNRLTSKTDLQLLCLLDTHCECFQWKNLSAREISL